jgi:hypothetical protein
MLDSRNEGTFHERIVQFFLDNTGILICVAAAHLDKYCAVLYWKIRSGKGIGSKNDVFTQSKKSDRRNNFNNEVIVKEEIIKLSYLPDDFELPLLDLDYLHNYACGTYQLNWSSAYAEAYVYENGNDFELQMSPKDECLIR